MSLPSTVFATRRSLIASQEACEQLLKQYGVRENLDSLHAVVTEARARKQAGYDGHDVWREDLSPGAAVRARTVPVLEKERERLRAELQSVRPFPSLNTYGISRAPRSWTRRTDACKVRCRRMYGTAKGLMQRRRSYWTFWPR